MVNWLACSEGINLWGGKKYQKNKQGDFRQDIATNSLHFFFKKKFSLKQVLSRSFSSSRPALGQLV